MKKNNKNSLRRNATLSALILLLSVAFVSFKSTTNDNPDKPLKGTINISGTRFLFPLLEKWGEAFKKENPGVNFVIKSGVENKDIDASAAPVKRIDSSKGNYVVVSRFALVPIANSKNPALGELRQKGISKEDFLKIYFKGDGKTNNFNLKQNIVVPIHVYSRSACASATFTNHFNKEIKDLDNVGGKIEDDNILLENIFKDSLGIAYNNLGFVYNLATRKQKNGITVIPIDINGNGKIDKDENFYDNLDVLLKRLEKTNTDLPPTGDLTLIFKNDKPEVEAFVKWILNKGQQYNNELGFLSLQTAKK